MEVNKKLAGKIDLFIEKIFLFGKMVSAIVLAAAVCIIVWSAFEIVSLSDSLSVPTYDQLQKKSKGNQRSDVGRTSFLEQVSRRDAINTKYEDEILKIVDYCYQGKGASKRDYETARDIIVKWVEGYSKIGVDEEFIDGLLKCLESGYSECCRSSKKDDFDGVHLINEFHSEFDVAVARMQVSEQEAARKRMNGWVVLGSATGSLIVFLIIPLLIRQEENTRAMRRLLDMGLFDDEKHGNYHKIIESGVANTCKAIEECCGLQTRIVNILEKRTSDDTKATVRREGEHVRIKCLSCDNEIEVPAEIMSRNGQHVRCPYCGVKFEFSS